MLRQFVHLSGLLFVGLAHFLDSMQSAVLFLVIGLFFFLYWEYIKIKKKPLMGLRNLAFFFERKDVRPFTGAVWFYIGGFLAFVLFPHNIASASVSILAVGDSLSTVFGVKFGRHKLIGKKSLEGSLAFFASSFLVSLIFVNPLVGFFGSLTGALVELLIPQKIGKKAYWFLDDNLLIPVISGAVMWILNILLFL